MNPRLRRYVLLVLALLLVGVGAFFAWRWTHPAPVGLQAVVRKGLAPVAPDTPSTPFPQPVVVTLSNGLHVFVIEDHRLPTIECRLTVRAGRVFEPLPGLATLTAALMTEGTQSRNEFALAQATEQQGATLTAWADDERAVLRLSGPAESAPLLLSLLSDVVQHPAFAPNSLAQVKFRKTAWNEQQTNASRVRDRISGRLFYGDTPYAALPPTADDFQALTQQDVIAFYTDFYRPNGASLGIIGDVHSADIQAQIARQFSSWSAAALTPPLPVARFVPKTSSRVSLADWQYNTDTILTFQCLAVSRSDPDYVPFLVTNQILGGYSCGRLFNNLRESQGYTYSASSWITAPSWSGLWTAAATVPDEDTEATVALVLAELRRLRQEPVPVEELARAKRSLIGSDALLREEPNDLLYLTSEPLEYHLPPSYWQTYPARVQAVTAADVQRVAQKYLADTQLQIIAIGPRARIERALRRYGPVDNFDDKGYPVHDHHTDASPLPAWLRAW